MTPRLRTLSAPAAITRDHDLAAFDCGAAALTEWLKRRALRNELDGASRTFVVAEKKRVVGYYSLSAASLSHAAATGRVKRNMPDPLPAILLGRLAADVTLQGTGLGADLLQDATLRVLGAAETIGVRVMLVHAISEAAKRFYEKHGFRPSPIDPMTLMITVDEITQSLTTR